MNYEEIEQRVVYWLSRRSGNPPITAKEIVVRRHLRAAAERRQGFQYVGPGWRWPGVFAAVSYLNTKHQRDAQRQEKLLWVLLALLVFAPEIIWIARRLLK